MATEKEMGAKRILKTIVHYSRGTYGRKQEKRVSCYPTDFCACSVKFVDDDKAQGPPGELE